MTTTTAERPPMSAKSQAVHRVLFWIYAKTTGLLSYGLLILLTYACLWGLTGKDAKKPVCRKEWLEERSFITCSGGLTFSVFVFYASACFGGALTELVGLPDWMGMLLSGLVLRFSTPFYGEWPIFHVPRFRDNPKDSLSFPVFYIASTTNVVNDISTRVRKIALATILTRAGLSLDTVVIRHAAREVALMAIIPCLTEAMLFTIISKFVFQWPWAWAAMIGFLLAAISPFVLVPDEMRVEVAHWGLMDLIVIAGFGLAFSSVFVPSPLTPAPLLGSIIGAAVGLFLGLLVWFLPPTGVAYSNELRAALFLTAAIALIGCTATSSLAATGAIACMFFSITISICGRRGWTCYAAATAQQNNSNVTRSRAGLASEPSLASLTEMQSIMAGLWWFLQPLLFCLLGADIPFDKYNWDGISSCGLIVQVIFCAAVIRLFTRFCAPTKRIYLPTEGTNEPTKLTAKHRIFAAIAWMPKASVQAAIGGLVLDAARQPGQSEFTERGTQIVLLTVLSILITTPIMAITMLIATPFLLTPDWRLHERHSAASRPN